MKNKLFFCVPALLFAIVLNSCSTKYDKDIKNPGFVNSTDTVGTLKAGADIPIGVAIDYTPALTDAKYISLVKNEFDGVTFSYNMKHGSVVQDNGSFNFTNADAMVNASSGLEIFGHTLGWHENQNATYLKNFAGLVTGAGPELLQQGGFESGGASSIDNWYIYNSGSPAGTSTITVGSGANEVRTGTLSMKVINPQGYPGEQWRVQVASGLVTTNPGSLFTISYWVKAANAGGSIRLSTQDASGGSGQYEGDQMIGTSWQQVIWNITANSAQTRFFFDMGEAANSYFIDDVSVKGLVVVAPGAQIAAKLDIALNDYVTTMVTRYKGKVKAWDVVNELFDNSGNIRNNANSPNANKANDYFVWSAYLGRDYALNAFNYAKAADPSASLFINDYGLESNNTKLDSLISYVAELKSRGAKVDGIGTQMHINFTTKHDGIDNMMKKLAATGLKIRISELDVRVNQDLVNGYIFTPFDAFGQEEMYRYVINSYRKNIPKAQQFGITIWGLTDNTSWLYNNGKDFPLLFDKDYKKKSTYAAVLSALKNQ